MKYVSITFKSLLALSMLVFFAAAGSTPVHAFTYEEERQLGKEIYEKIRDAGLLIEDEELNSYITEIGKRLLSYDNVYPFDFTFSVIRSSGINAFATPGGYVYLYTGLINLAENECHIAGVMAHEIAHVNARHVARMIEKSKRHTIGTLAAMVAGAFLGGGEGLAAATGLATATSVTMSLKYSREHEEEADRLGMAYLTGAGYDGKGMLDFLKIMDFNQYYSSSIPTYFLTHPETSERVRYLTLLLQTRYNQEGAGEIFGGLERYQTRLRLRYHQPRDNVRYFSERVSRNPDDLEALYGLAVSQHRMGEVGPSRRNFSRALELNPNDWEILRDFGIHLFQQGSIEEALGPLEKARSLKGDDRDILFYLGRTYESIGEYGTALDIFKKINEMDAEDKDTYYHLAMIYGKMDQLGESHYHFGQFFKRAGKKESAMFHFKTALGYFPESSPRVVEIRREMESLQPDEG